ncbi:MAG: carbohydrate ABC transporter permease [Spirochaetales bacterium]|nr:carbohydrate ABC transporter permease [Spirochaetales bacterium]MBP7263154.1 carbohydrate ABC transporter permease [Spirochaetia bacterium]
MRDATRTFGARGKVRRLSGRVLLNLTLIAVCAIWLVPTVGLLVSSLRPKELIAVSGWWEALASPLRLTLENYVNVLSRANMGTSFLNSLMVAIPGTLIPMCIAAYAAYAFAWMEFKGKEWMYLVVIALIAVPIQMTLIPVLRLFNTLGITGSFMAVWLAHAAYGLPFSIYLLRNFIGQLPRSMLESAFIDGASHPVVFFRLVLPTSLPAIASLGIFQFMWVWNDLLVSLIFLGGTPDVAPMTVTIANMVNSYGGGWEYLTAAAFISMALPLVVFFALQKYFVRGVLAGSVKE